MSDRVQYIILCEDKQAQVFIRRALLEAGANPRRIRDLPLPSEVGGGAGHAYVLQRYPTEVKAFRTQNAHAATGLMVHIDADVPGSVADRHDQLASALAASQQNARTSTERIVELVPKRNIETWIFALDPALAQGLSRPLDEVTALPKLRGNERACATAAEAFAGHARAQTTPPTANIIPSLLDGVDEFRRLP